MNFCLKCHSAYSQPGTCNCFARTAPEIQPAPGVVPITPSVPFVPYVPTYPTTIPWWQTWISSPVIGTIGPSTSAPIGFTS